MSNKAAKKARKKLLADNIKTGEAGGAAVGKALQSGGRNNPADGIRRGASDVVEHPMRTESPTLATPLPRTDSGVIKKVIGGIGFMLALIALVVSLWPRVSIAVSDPPDQSNALSASFTITNTGLIPLHHLTPSIGLGHVKGLADNGVFGVAEPPFGTHLYKVEWRDHTLDFDEKYTITPADLIGAEISDAEIAIVVDYQPWIIPWKRSKLFRFNTHTQPNGHLSWYSAPTT